MHPDVIIASRPQAQRLLMSKDPRALIRHVISISAPGESVPSGFEQCATGIHLEFFDVLEDNGFEYGPKASHVEQVIEFAHSIQDQDGKLLVHCEAGISRSSAAALTVFATWLGVGKEREAVGNVYAVRPQAWPNTLFVELADQLLERGGALIAALDRTGRGRYGNSSASKERTQSS
jgi:predicted protein tyrosine phosphatase